jgi:hypothetical protein
MFFALTNYHSDTLTFHQLAQPAAFKFSGLNRLTTASTDCHPCERAGPWPVEPTLRQLDPRGCYRRRSLKVNLEGLINLLRRVLPVRASLRKAQQ